MAGAHVPLLADPEPAGPRRSLILAGGGIRVAYQSGVLVALEEAGLRFSHADGTSGGCFTLAMLLSGVTPSEACERWRRLDVRAFAAPPPLRRLLRLPPYPALGSADTLRSTIYPQLGVDVSRLRAAEGIAGTFNVCDYGSKLNRVIEHRDADLDVLVAGVSLPLFLPAVRRGGSLLLDAVWIKDANVAEAIRRGADELWLVWCIGNHGVYRDGLFQQYVHMIEMSANGSLFEQLAQVAALNASGREPPVRLHVIRPLRPLPLDPDFVLGRVDAATLVAMGYRDACHYLASRREDGVPLDASATRMLDPRPGVAFRERLRGEADGPLELQLGWEVDDLQSFVTSEEPAGTLVGHVSHPALGAPRLLEQGSFRIRGREVTAELRMRGASLRLTRTLQDWRRARVELSVDGSSVLAGGVSSVGAPVWTTLHARGVGSAREGLAAVARFVRWELARRRQA